MEVTSCNNIVTGRFVDGCDKWKFRILAQDHYSIRIVVSNDAHTHAILQIRQVKIASMPLPHLWTVPSCHTGDACIQPKIL